MFGDVDDKSFALTWRVGQGLAGAAKNALASLGQGVSRLPRLRDQSTQHPAEWIALGLRQVRLFALANREPSTHGYACNANLYPPI